MLITFNTAAAGNESIEVDAIKLTGIPLPEGKTERNYKLINVKMKIMTKNYVLLIV